jgi:hypothetical protein
MLLVAVSLTAVLVAALPALRELSRAARSAEKLFDTLSRELPPTLEAIRLTGLEITDLTDEVSEGVQSAGRVVQQIDQSLSGVKRQAKQAQVVSRSLVVGFKAAWKAFNRPPSPRRREGSARDLASDERIDRLPPSTRSPLDLEEDYVAYPEPYPRSHYAEEGKELGEEGELDGAQEATLRRQKTEGC